MGSRRGSMKGGQDPTARVSAYGYPAAKRGAAATGPHRSLEKYRMGVAHIICARAVCCPYIPQDQVYRTVCRYFEYIPEGALQFAK